AQTSARRRPMQTTFARFSLALGLVLSLGCTEDPNSALDPRPEARKPVDALDANATVRFSPLEGGCWLLEIGDERVEPVGMPEKYRVDGLRIYVVVRRAPNLATRCMMGPVVTLDVVRAG
ncbi:MAG: hypothetical protein ACKVS7_08270, partial [Gemmatimonadaceae bacterium]